MGEVTEQWAVQGKWPEGFIIAIPKEWMVMDPTGDRMKALGQDLVKFKDIDETVRHQVLEMLSTATQQFQVMGVALLAYPPLGNNETLPPQLSVSVLQKNKVPSLDEVKERLRLSDALVESITLDGLPGYRITQGGAHLHEQGLEYVRQSLVTHTEDDRAFLITFLSPSVPDQSLRETFDHIEASFGAVPIPSPAKGQSRDFLLP